MHRILLVAFVVLGLQASRVYCGNYQFVIAPNVIRLNTEEVITCAILGDGRNQRFTLWFEVDGKKVSDETVADVTSQEEPFLAKMKVTEEKLFKEGQNKQNVVRRKDLPTKVTLKANGPQGFMSKVIKLSYKPGYIIVQTDKPLYTPRENVKIRVLAMDESLKPVTDVPVIIDIVTPNGNRTVDRTKIVSSESGFYKTELELPPFPDTGMWTAKAKFGGKYETVGVSPFEVKEFVLPTFGVTINVADEDTYILEDKNSLQVSVDATYVYKEKVKGSVTLEVYVHDKTNPEPDGNTYITSYKNPLADGVADFNIDIGVVKDEIGSFPEGSYLELKATVREDVTGKQESVIHSSIIFATSPYKFDLTTSKRTYRPGVPYVLKINMMYANGQPAREKGFTVTGTSVVGKIDEKTREDGSASVSVNTESGRNVELKFKVSAEGTSEEIGVIPYAGKNQIEVEKVEKNGIPQLRANTNIQGDKYSDILFLVILRGKIVDTFFAKKSSNVRKDLTDQLLRKISPGARVLAFYVDQSNNELVADATRFSVDPVCQGEQLVVGTNTERIKPGDQVTFQASGDNLAWVGFNVIDKALLLLNKDNILKHNTIFKALESHDLGCGMGGGRDNTEVFKMAGLTLMTNSFVSIERQQGLYPECEQVETRWKRSSECSWSGQTVDAECCTAGQNYADNQYDIFMEAEDEDETLIPEVTCKARGKELGLQTTKKLPMRCIMAFYKSCVKTLSMLLSDSGMEEGRSILGGATAFEEDLALLKKQNFRPSAPRSKFETSFFFDEIKLDKDGKGHTRKKFQDSITEWAIQAVSLSSDHGACVAQDKFVNAFQDFFIQLDLPYKASRLELFDIKATVFNYHNTPKTASVYLDGMNGLCYDKAPGEKSEATGIELAPNGAGMVRFPIIPLEDGEFDVTVTAMVVQENSISYDSIKKTLYVVNEGEEVKKNIVVCLDPNDQMKNCKNDQRVKVHAPTYSGDRRKRLLQVDLGLPEEAIPGTGSATAYLQSDVMEATAASVLAGVDSLFREPHGCGEQTMIYTAPIVYAMHYLKQIGKLTSDQEKNGGGQMKKGIQRERTEFMKSDYSYAAWKDYPTSLWLTAFVAKVFCQADHVKDGIVDKPALAKTIGYIVKNAGRGGQFKDNKPVIHREMQGGIGGTDRSLDPSLSAFVLITLQECEKSGETEPVIRDTISFLENFPMHFYKQNPYLLAITTYALAMSNSKKKDEFRKNLMLTKIQEGEMIHWGKDSFAVETTSYALLALLQFDDIRTSNGVVMWLTTERKANGMSSQTQNTVVMLQALAEYSIRTYDVDVNFDVKLDKEKGFSDSRTITKDNADNQMVIRGIPVEKDSNTLVVDITGTGYGLMNIDLRYNIPLKKKECRFILNVEKPSEVFQIDFEEGRNCDVCGVCDDPKDPDYNAVAEENEEDDNEAEGRIGRRRRQADEGFQPIKKCMRMSVRLLKKGDKKAGMSIVWVNLETGVKVDADDIRKLQEDNDNIEQYELPENGKGYIIFYLKEIGDEPTDFVFRLEDAFEGDKHSRQVATVKVYDYYQPDESCITYYSVGPNHGHGAVSYECDGDKTVCQCMKSMCIPQFEEPVIKAVDYFRNNGGPTPFEQLYDYACNPANANFVVLVIIAKADYSPDKNEKWAIGIVQKVMNKGREEYAEGDEMTFTWQFNCDQPKLKKGKEYLIIGKDSTLVQNKHRYSLMGSARVIALDREDLSVKNKRFIKKVVGKLGQLFERKLGCSV